MYDVILVRFGEIGLKGRNRPAFEGQLMQAIRRALSSFQGIRVSKEYGRLIVTLPRSMGPNDFDLGEMVKRLASVFGIVSVSPAVRLGLDLSTVEEAAPAIVTLGAESMARAPRTFKVETRRPNKRFPHRTPEINASLGARILQSAQELDVDLHTPDITLFVEVRESAVYAYTQIIAGPGGLPIGSSSRGLLLLSGGIDSPVAGWLAMKRGIRLEAIHFHSPPYTSERSKEKVLELASILGRYSPEPIPTHVVRFTPIQEAIRDAAPEAMVITLMRRMMLRIATRLADAKGIPALITGESVGQVASQTLESMQTINAVTNLPVLRPLVSMDKSEIVALSERIGAYDTSVLPYEDCCTLFVPKHPETKPRVDRAEAAEKALDIQRLVSEAVEGVVRIVRE